MYILGVYVHAACPGSMDMDMQHGHGHGHAAWTWTCSIDMGMQHNYGHTTFTVLYWGMQHGHLHINNVLEIFNMY
jgi:hypothetical protein